MEDKGMLTGNLWKAIPLFAFPVAATSILEQLSSLIATVVIGKVPGPEGTLGMAAVGANTPIMSLILNLFIGISLGTNVVIANTIIQAGINSLGTEVMAASSAAMSLEHVFYNLLNSFSQACTTFVGQAFGARNIPRCKQVLKVCLAEDLVVAIATVAGVVFFGRSILAVFNSDPNVVSIGYIRVCTIFPAYIFSMCYENFSGYLRGFGISLAPAILTALGICGIRFWWVFGVFPAHHDFQTIMLVYPISLCVTAILIVSSALVIHPAKTFGKKDTNGTAVAVVA